MFDNQQSSPTPAATTSSAFHSGIRHLSWHNDAKLMSCTLRNGTRAADPARKSTLHAMQQFVVRNNSAFWDRGENTIFEASPVSMAAAAAAFPVGAQATTPQSLARALPPESAWRKVMRTKIVRDGSIIGYDIEDVTTGTVLLKVHDHGDTNSALQRTFKAFFRSPVRKWDVENRQLFHDVPNGTRLGVIHDVFPDHRVMFPDPPSGLPRLEMQTLASLGTKYALAVTDVPEPVGWVESAVIGRFTPRNETYVVALRNSTREEAVLWMTMVIATDMKRRRVQNTQYGRAPCYLPVFCKCAGSNNCNLKIYLLPLVHHSSVVPRISGESPYDGARFRPMLEASVQDALSQHPHCMISPSQQTILSNEFTPSMPAASCSPPEFQNERMQPPCCPTMEAFSQLPAFVSSLPSGLHRDAHSRRLCHRRILSATPRCSPSVRSRTACTAASPTPDEPPSPPSSSSSTQLKVGQIVAIQREGALMLSGGPELGMVTGCSSSGETVDVQPLEAFVKELYVVSKRRDATFEKASDIRAVNYEYAPTQDAWIVLDEDLVEAQNFFRARVPPTSTEREQNITVQVSDDRPELSDQAKKRQFFRPTKQQAFVAALLSLPLSAAFWSAFATARDTFIDNPAGNDFLHGNFFRALVQFVTAGSSVSSLVVGSALFLYALSKSDDAEGA